MGMLLPDQALARIGRVASAGTRGGGLSAGS